MERYIPERELPKDIQKLPREETVCQFCGVSYLVHHEIKALEEMVQKLQTQLERLDDLEKEKAYWEKKENKLTNQTVEQQEQISSLQSSLASTEYELSVVRTHDMEKKEELEVAHSELQKVRAKEACLVSSLKRMKSSASCLGAGQLHLQKLIQDGASQFATMKMQVVNTCASYEDQWREECSKLKEKVVGLERSLEEEVHHLEKVKEKLGSSQQDQYHQLTKAHARAQKLQTEITDAKKRSEAKALESQGHQRRADSLACKVLSLQDEIAVVKESSDRQIAEKDRKNRDLQYSLRDANAKLTSAEGALVEKQKELLETTHFYGFERDSLKNSLQKTEEELRLFKHEIHELREHFQEKMQELRRNHNEEVERMRRTLAETHEEELESLRDEHKLMLRNSSSKITKLRSTLAAAELEHQRLMKAWQEELRKEKSVLDREMSVHLEQVKDLELQLADEKKAVTSANHALEKCVQEMKGNEMQCHELQSKLCSAYQEVRVLQATVQKECEEREKLQDELHRLMAATATLKK